MKVGIDLHGVITNNSIIWSETCQSLMVSGCEVHILTESTRADALTELCRLKMFQGQHYTNIVSVIDYLLSKKLALKDDKNDLPSFDIKKWNSAKGELAEELDLDVHYDDNLEYKKYFKRTKFEHYVNAPKG